MVIKANIESQNYSFNPVAVSNKKLKLKHVLVQSQLTQIFTKFILHGVRIHIKKTHPNLEEKQHPNLEEKQHPNLEKKQHPNLEEKQHPNLE